MRIYIDMDGVLADFDRKRREVFGENPVDDETAWDIIFKQHPYWFLDLEPMWDIRELVEFLNPYDPIILTAIPKGNNHYRALAQKQAWLINWIYWPIICCQRRHKKDYAREFPDAPCILIDDSEQNIAEFKKAGGIGVLHTNANSTIKKLKVIINTFA